MCYISLCIFNKNKTKHDCASVLIKIELNYLVITLSPCSLPFMVRNEKKE